MEIKIQAVHFDATEQLTAFATKKIEKLQRKSPEISHVEVRLHVVKPETALNKEAVITVKYPGKPDIVVSKKADTFEEAIDLCIAAIEPQLEKAKERR